jgi:hypothetical protein
MQRCTKGFYVALCLGITSQQSDKLIEAENADRITSYFLLLPFPSLSLLLPSPSHHKLPTLREEGVGPRDSPIKTFLYTTFPSVTMLVHKPRSGFPLTLHLTEGHWFNNNGYHGGLRTCTHADSWYSLSPMNSLYCFSYMPDISFELCLYFTLLF